MRFLEEPHTVLHRRATVLDACNEESEKEREREREGERERERGRKAELLSGRNIEIKICRESRRVLTCLDTTKDTERVRPLVNYHPPINFHAPYVFVTRYRDVSRYTGCFLPTGWLLRLRDYYVVPIKLCRGGISRPRAVSDNGTG